MSHATPNSPTRIPVNEDAELRFEDQCWKFYYDGKMLRYLDSYEVDHIEATIRATLALRSETATTKALRDFCEAFENRNETTSLHIWNNRLKAAYANAKEVLAGREPYKEPQT